MSDSVTNVEIEDVLSSIRRLVTEEYRSDSGEAQETRTQDTDRLVLTPSLRIATPEDAGADDEPGGQTEASQEVFVAQEPINLAESLSDDTDQDDIDEEAEAVSQEAEHPDQQDWSEHPEDAETDDLTESAESVVDEIAFKTEDTGTEQAESSDVEDEESGASDTFSAARPWEDPDAFLFQAAQFADQQSKAREKPFETTREVETQDVDVDVDVDVEPEADHSEEVDEVLSSAQDNAAVPEADQEPEDAEAPEMEEPLVFSHTESEEKSSDQEEEYDVFRRSASLSAKIEALEATIAETQDQWEPDGEVGDDYAGTQVDTIEWQDHDDDTPDDDPAEEPAAAPEQAFVAADPETDYVEETDEDGGALDYIGANDAILDEDTLRELVADIVREELQGALGERITRNVRKLVRREIHRAMTVQEMD